MDGIKQVVNLVPCADFTAVHGNNGVAFLQTSGFCGAFCQDTVHDRRKGERDEGRLLLQGFEQIELTIDVDVHILPIAEHVHGVSIAQIAEHRHVIKVSVGLFVHARDEVTVLESEFLGFCVERHAVSDALEWDALFAIYPEEHSIDEECHEEVDQYTTHHHKKTLPSWLVLEKFVSRNVGFFLCHCIGIGAFVHHAGDFYISTEGKPANDKVCLAPTTKF